MAWHGMAWHGMAWRGKETSFSPPKITPNNPPHTPIKPPATHLGEEHYALLLQALDDKVTDSGLTARCVVGEGVGLGRSGARLGQALGR